MVKWGSAAPAIHSKVHTYGSSSSEPGLRTLYAANKQYLNENLQHTPGERPPGDDEPTHWLMPEKTSPPLNECDVPNKVKKK